MDGPSGSFSLRADRDVEFAEPALAGDMPDHLSVKFRPGVDPVAASARHGATIIWTSGLNASSRGSNINPGWHLLAIPPGTLLAQLAAFGADPQVESAGYNSILIGKLTSDHSAASDPACS
jgi:hypothetical protein